MLLPAQQRIVEGTAADDPMEDVRVRKTQPDSPRVQQAEKNIDDQLDELASTTRTTRLSAITEALLDVIAGFEALKHRRARPVDLAKPGIFVPSDTLPAADG